MDYDQNLTMCGRVATQVVCLTFAVGTFRRSEMVSVHGNQMGLDAIAQAVERVCVRPEGESFKLLDGPDALYCDDDDEMGAEWLNRFLISAEITSISPLGEPAP